MSPLSYTALTCASQGVLVATNVCTSAVLFVTGKFTNVPLDEFEEPELFNPERFLKTEFGTKPGDREPYYHRANIAFGAGRVSLAGYCCSDEEMAHNGCREYALVKFSPRGLSL